MDDFQLTRRKALAALGSIGVASAGAGLGTSAYFSDQETFENNQLTAGTLDMKVAATEYYSDWSPDEAQYAGMASDTDSTDIRLPPGDGQTDAQAIALDLDDDYGGDASDVYAAFFETISTDADGNPYNRVNEGVSAASGGLCGTESDADGPVIIDIGDVKPGDFGGAQFAFELCDNPGYVWLTGGLRDANENGVTEPEDDDPDEESGVVELLDAIQVAYGVGPINDGSTAFEDTTSGFQPVEQYTLREFLATLGGDGIALDGDIDAESGGGTGDQGCFAGGNPSTPAVHEVSVVWWLPIDHGNQVQSDSVTFDLGFYTEQCRHNDGETDLVAYYPFEGSADDVSGNGYDGTVEGDVSYASGQVGSAAANGTNGYIALPNFPDDPVESGLTISAWINTADNSVVGQRIFADDENNTGGYAVSLCDPGPGAVRFYSRNKDTISLDTPDGVVQNDTWHHVVGVYDDVAKERRIYVDGVLEATLTDDTGSWETDSGTATIGGETSSSGESSRQFEGSIDDVRIYSRALSASEVQALYDSA